MPWRKETLLDVGRCHRPAAVSAACLAVRDSKWLCAMSAAFMYYPTKTDGAVMAIAQAW